MDYFSFNPHTKNTIVAIIITIIIPMVVHYCSDILSLSSSLPWDKYT